MNEKGNVDDRMVAKNNAVIDANEQKNVDDQVEANTKDNAVKSAFAKASEQVAKDAKDNAVKNAVADAKEQATTPTLSNQVGLGIDVVEIDRMKKILTRTPSFAQRVFSKDEQTYCNSRTIPAAQYAMRFAAKEAVLKALNTSFTQGIGVRDIEVCRNAKGKYYINLAGRAKEIANKKNIDEIPISLSYTHKEAVACAIAIAKKSQEEAQERNRKDPMDELVQQFRQTRKMLDSIDV